MKDHKMPPIDIEEITQLLIGVWRRFMKLSGPADVLQTREFRTVVEAVQKLQVGLETSNNLVGQDYFSDPQLLGAYLLYNWQVHYQQGLSLINELPGRPGRVLDLASGPGAFAFAALKQGAKEVIAIDKSEKALQMAAEACGRSGYPLSIRNHNVLRFPYPVEGKFDLIIVGHCLSELFPDTLPNWKEAQKIWIDKLTKLLSPQGMLLLVENSFQSSNHRILQLRDCLVTEGLSVQAPCVWKGACPALASKNLCYAQRSFEKSHLIKNIQRAAQINLSSLKMTYLIVRSPELDWPQVPDYPIYRVISPPIDAHGGKRFHLCGTDGKKDIGSRLKEVPVDAKAFSYLKRGELISVEDAFVRQDHFDIVLGTRIKVEAALNKPLPDYYNG